MSPDGASIFLAFRGTPVNAYYTSGCLLKYPASAVVPALAAPTKKKFGFFFITPATVFILPFQKNIF
jgi:hypothetical protein